MTDQNSGLARTAQIVRSFFKDPSAGVLTGIDLAAATQDITPAHTEGTPQQFVDDPEAPAPTSRNIGQALSPPPHRAPPPS